ncbi:MAG: hydrogenase maturation protease superfamily [Clostridia bacterium]|jgi:hydrogenase maturation protease|nr:hydrogenase maturation protease superfamily [Clostridia bacterium]
MIKVFGIGNILLCDDAIGIRVLEALLPYINSLSPYLKAFVGETDCFFCLDCIDEDDYVIIIDATYLGIEPGSISYFTFSECSRFITPLSSAHEMTLLKLLMLEYPAINGCLIGIEIDKIDFSLELSPVLEGKMESICTEILKFLESVVKTYA